MNHNTKHQEGNILITSLLVLLVLNILGLGLINSSVQDSSVATFKEIESKVFHITESCTQDMITYLESQSTTPATPYTINEDDLSHMYDGDESDTELIKLAGYSYTCTLTEVTSKALTASDDGEGKSLGDGDGYSSDGDLSPTYYFQIVSTGSGPKNATKTINTIVEVEF